MAEATAPCVVVVADDAEARLLGQALNHIVGQDNDGLRGELLRQLLEALPQEEVLAILPDSARRLEALTSLGQEDMAAHLRAWEQTQGARLVHLTLQFQKVELAVVQQALGQAMGLLTEPGGSPNLRGQALAAICLAYLKNFEKGGIV
jgi:ParB family chromosome partitioning protein